MTSVFSWQNSVSLCPTHFVLQGETCLLIWVSLTTYFCIPVPYDEKGHLFLVLVLEDVVSLPRDVQLQLLWHLWLGHKLGLLWYWIVCLGREQRLFCHFWDCTQVLHFELFCWPWGLFPFLQGGSQFWLHVVNCFVDLLFVAFVIIIILNGLPGDSAPLLDCKLKCLCSAYGEIVCPWPSVNGRD